MSTITKERLLKIQQWRETYGPGSNIVLLAEEAEELVRIALASLDAEKGASLQLRNLIRQRHAEWSNKTFGDVGPVGPLKHLSKEALEAAAEPEDLSEWADMQFLLWDAQRRAGICDGEITAAMEEKLKVNMARQWPEPKDGEPRLHIKSPPAPVALASLEAEGSERNPVLTYADSYRDMAKQGVESIPVWSVITDLERNIAPLYTAPPAPVSVPDEATPENIEILASTFAPRGVTYQWDRDECNAAADSWNACRAAMLQGAETVTTAYKLPEGWVAVPVEPTEDMIVNGFESEPDESFSDEREWEAYDAMSGCQQAAHRAKLCWAAMIAAAPQQEVKL